MSVDEFLIEPPQEEQPVAKTNARKKRKRHMADTPTENTDSPGELMEKAKVLASTSEQWGALRGMTESELAAFVDQAEFSQQQVMYDMLSQVVTKCAGFVLDTALRGRGFVSREVENDLTLRQCVSEECKTLAKVINNRYRILMLTAMDSVNGKQAQLKALPPPAVVEPDKEKADHVEST